MKRNTANLPRDASGLVTFTWLGGYPMFYLDSGNDVLCPKCARELQFDAESVRCVVAGDVNWEDPSLFCEACSQRIESAYAEDEA